ncbi:MAG: methyl-accepting chemotaxis protein [Planctomycetota bacterium]|nr:MAG: methyl-accepting chemotaxis protein [Planctomycetota bacterium]
MAKKSSTTTTRPTAQTRSDRDAVFNEIERFVDKIKRGELSERINLDRFEGQDRAMLQSINDLVGAFAVPIKDIGDVLDKLAAGDSKAQVTADYKGDYNVLKVACNALGDQINGLVQEMGKIADATAVGNLDYRGDASRFKGDLAEVVNGANRTVEGAAVPVKDIGDTLDKLAAGDSKAQVTADYKGNYNVLKVACNALGNQLKSLILEDGGVVLNAAARKDLTKRVERQYKGDFEKMKNNINEMLNAFEEALGQVTEAVEQVASASGQVSSASQSLAEGATEQAAGLEETSSSLEEMSSMTKQNADNAQQANTLAGEAQKAANSGNEAMNRMDNAINEIQKSSDETAKIIKVIDEIAFQTNLLALNAAVEAARAGEAGKGFAVVAEEVRNLAMRSAEAAKNTTAMIDESVKNAKNGVDIATDVGKTFGEIVSGITKTGNLVSEIAAASQEQAQGIDQINTAMAQMDKVTQQNAANAEESASASEELSAQAEGLQAMVAEFKLTNTGTRSSTTKHVDTAKHHGLGQSDHVFHSIADGKAQKAKATVAATAEKAIPLNESYNNDDLNEFNS